MTSPHRLLTTLSGTACLLVSLLGLAGCVAPGPTAAFATRVVPAARVSGPLEQRPLDATHDTTFFASDVALASRGYVEEEFFIEGQANVYDTPQVVVSPTLPPSRLASTLRSGVPYKTRVVVRRPTDATRFNGTVVVEWLNVTDNFDGEYIWVQAKDHLLRQGYAWVGLSAQDNSISVSPLSLKKFSAARYASLDVTGQGRLTQDELSYDIFAQATQAVRLAPLLMGGMPVRKVIGAGMSQSALRLGVYLNYLHMQAPVHDAFLIQVMNPTLRDDLTTPVIKVISETEASPVQLSVAQEDTPTRRSWWVAGSSHGDATQRIGRTAVRIRDLGLANTPNDSCGAGGATPTRSRVPLRHVIAAAVESLQRAVDGGAPMPSSPPLRSKLARFELSLVRDGDGLAQGGIQLAHTAVPTARADGLECGAVGVWAPFDDARLAALYPSHAAYVDKVKAATAANVKAGVVLGEDAAETVAEAEGSVIGRGLPCGPLCLSVGHFREDRSSTGLLRDRTLYYKPLGTAALLTAVDAAHLAVATAYSHPAGSAPRREQAERAAAALRQYQALVASARSEGRLTPTAANALDQEAVNIVRALASM